MGQRVEIVSSLKDYTLVMNGAEADVRFSPTDSFFAERIYKTMDALSKKEDEHDAQVQKAMGKPEVFDLARQRDAEMRDMVNAVYGQDVCSVLFADCATSAMGDGLPGWLNLMLATLDLMDASIVSEQKAGNPRVKKYTDKYSKYQQFQKK